VIRRMLLLGGWGLGAGGCELEAGTPAQRTRATARRK
jgi:hypothetical protein